MQPSENEAPDAAPEPEASHNPVFEQLVGEEGDLVGMIAYALYKRAKREWIIAHKPNEEQRRDYHKFVTPSQIDIFRAEANSKLIRYAQSVVTDTSPEIAKRAIDESILKEVKRQNSWWMNVLAGIVGAAIIAAILFAIAFFLGPSPQDVAAKVRQGL